MSTGPIVSGMLNQEITGIYATTRDGYGRVTKTLLYSEIPCRWQELFQMVLDKTGVEVVAKVQVWVPDEYNGNILDIDNDYILVYNSKEYTVIACEDHVNILGDREYIKLYLR